MISARVQQSPRLVELAWLVYDSHLARLVGSWLIKSMKTAKYYGSELSEVDRRDHDCYWYTIENTMAPLDRSFESEKSIIQSI